MHHPLPSPHGKGVILGYLQIIHRLRPRHHLPASHDSHMAIRSQEVHPQLDLAHRQEAVFHREEWVLLAGMDHLACSGRWFARLTLPAFPNSGASSRVISVESARDKLLETPQRVRVLLLASNLSHYLSEWRDRLSDCLLPSALEARHEQGRSA